MDILDNVIYATYNRQLNGGATIEGEYKPKTPSSTTLIPIGTGFGYDPNIKFEFMTCEDVSVIEKGIQRHWYDINNLDIYDTYSSFLFSSNYHLMYAYLLENTRMFQIFEKVLELFDTSEFLGIANNANVHSWMENTVRLFYKSDYPKATNIRSIIRPLIDHTRRNAYQRMFGMDLAFGGIDNTSINYAKSTQNNTQFIVIFERYLSEVWQAYVNANNTSGVNTTDFNIIQELSLELREMLIARRGNVNDNTYAYQHLSKEEFSSVLLASWFTFIISYDSPIVEYLGCQSSTIGERLAKIGLKVGVPAHTKAQSLFEMSNASTLVLLGIETEVLQPVTFLQDMVRMITPADAYMDAHLSLINNWEKATGHRIKNPQGNVTGSVMVKQAPLNGSMPKPVMN